MLIILGTFMLEDTADREAWLAKRVDNLNESRADPGCIEFTLGADPVDKHRVISFDSMHIEVSDVREVDIPQRFAPRTTEPGWWNGKLTPA